MSKEIRLTKGKAAIVDDADYEWLSKMKWQVSGRGSGYASHSYAIGGGTSRAVLMHRLIMGLTRGDGLQVDHINGDKFDNRRANLRVCTNAENMLNSAHHRGSRSSFVGVAAYGDGLWKAYIAHAGKQVHVGVFQSEADAARARDAEAIRLRGEFARLNFPANDMAKMRERERVVEKYNAKVGADA